MKKEELYLDELILVLIVLTVVLAGIWYYNELNLSKAKTSEKMAELQEICINQALTKSDCKITQLTQDLASEILCSQKLTATYSDFEQKIRGSYNLLWIKEQMQPAVTSGIKSSYTLGEFAAAKDFFERDTETKVQILQVIGAIEGCEYRIAKMKNYAGCDLKNAKMLVKKPQNEVSEFFLAESEKALSSDDYLKSIYYTSAAMAYSGENIRQAYADIVEASRTQGLVC